MLNVTQKITITGESIVDGVSIAGFSASINSNNPADMVLSMWQNNKQACKENRAIVRADQAEFEDFAYAKQDELIAAMEVGSDETVE